MDAASRVGQSGEICWARRQWKTCSGSDASTRRESSSEVCMKRSLFGAVGALAAVIVCGSCKEDPTASASGQVTTILLNPNPVIIGVGAKGSVDARVFDALLNPLPASFTATSSDPTVATIAPDPANPDPNGTRQRFTVTGLAGSGARVATVRSVVVAEKRSQEHTSERKLRQYLVCRRL